MPTNQARSPDIIRVDRDAFFVFAGQLPPDIPPGKGRDCPQCGHVAWAESRWCWHCQFDFDRASIPRLHPVKSTLLSAALLVGITAGLAVALLLRGG